MTVEEYLQKKYGVAVPTTMTKAEANIFGITFPLRSGWLAKHGKRRIQQTMFTDLCRMMKKRSEKQRQRGRERAAIISERGIKAATLPRIDGDAFLESYEWRRVRMMVLKRDGARCSCCGATAKDGVRMHVDHIKPRKTHPELALDPNNLQVLCEVCNHGKGNWDDTDWRPKLVVDNTQERGRA